MLREQLDRLTPALGEKQRIRFLKQRMINEFSGYRRIVRHQNLDSSSNSAHLVLGKFWPASMAGGFKLPPGLRSNPRVERQSARNSELETQIQKQRRIVPLPNALHAGSCQSQLSRLSGC